jgi:hypothetical protein
MSPFDLLVYLIAPEVGLGIVAVRTQGDLRSHGARPAAYVLLAIVTALSVLAPPVFLWRRDWTSVAMFVPAVAIYFVPSLAVKLTGGPSPLRGLTADAREMASRCARVERTNTATVEEEAWLRKRAEGLERWRTPETAELIEIHREKVMDLLYVQDRERFAERTAARDARIEELFAALRKRKQQEH